MGPNLLSEAVLHAPLVGHPGETVGRDIRRHEAAEILAEGHRNDDRSRPSVVELIDHIPLAEGDHQRSFGGVVAPLNGPTETVGHIRGISPSHSGVENRQHLSVTEGIPLHIGTPGTSREGNDGNDERDDNDETRHEKLLVWLRAEPTKRGPTLRTTRP